MSTSAATQVSSSPTSETPATTTTATETQVQSPATPDQGPVAEAQPQASSAESDTLAEKLALIAKRERHFELERQKFKKEQEEFKKRLESVETENKTYQEQIREKQRLYDAIKTRDFKALKEAGFDNEAYNDYTKFILNNEENTVENKIAQLERRFEEKLQASIKAKEDELSQKQQELYKSQEEIQLRNLKEEIKEFVSNEKDGENVKYPLLLNTQGYDDLVFHVMDEHYRSTTIYDDNGQILRYGKKLSYDEAAQVCEKHIENQYEEMIKKTPDRFKNIFDRVLPKEEPKPPTKVETRTPNTITQSMTPTTPPQNGGKKSPEQIVRESKERMMKLAAEAAARR